MKKLILLLILFIASLSTVEAQTIDKGFFIEGNIAYGSSHYKNYAIITPVAGYQFNSKWQAGMKVGFETGSLSYTIYTPFVRYNFVHINKLNLFTEAQFSYMSRDVDGGQNTYSEAGLSFGLNYPISRHLKLVGHYLFVGYSGKNGKEGASLGGGDFILDANSRRLQLGVQFLF